MNRNNVYAGAAIIAAFSIAVIAAYFSVSGIGKMFSGAAVAVMVMASVLEASKFLISGILNNFWESLSKSLRVYLISSLIVLMIITSAGIYGFLTSAYKKTSMDYNVVNKEIAIITKKKTNFELQLKDVYTELESINKDMGEKNNTLKLINNSEIADLSRSETKRRATQTTADILKLESRRDILENKKEYLSDTINKLEILSMETESKSSAVAELGPLMYISDITGKSMDVIVNWFTLMLVFVFDPLSICLFIVFNMLTSKKIDNSDVKEDENIETKEIKEIEKPDDSQEREEIEENETVKEKTLENPKTKKIKNKVSGIFNSLSDKIKNIKNKAKTKNETKNDNITNNNIVEENIEKEETKEELIEKLKDIKNKLLKLQDNENN